MWLQPSILKIWALQEGHNLESASIALIDSSNAKSHACFNFNDDDCDLDGSTTSFTSNSLQCGQTFRLQTPHVEFPTKPLQSEPGHAKIALFADDVKNNRGFSGRKTRLNQQEKLKACEAYVQSVASTKTFVGAHWFQYVDEPLSGRWFDGENYACGKLSITDF